MPKRTPPRPFTPEILAACRRFLSLPDDDPKKGEAFWDIGYEFIHEVESNFQDHAISEASFALVQPAIRIRNILDAEVERVARGVIRRVIKDGLVEQESPRPKARSTAN